MTTAYQEVLDRATTISINKRKSVAQTVARNGTVRSTSLGSGGWQFEVQLPSGPKWSEYRPLVEKMEALDKVTTATIQINASGQSYIVGYQGDFAAPNTVQVTYSSGNTLTISSNPEVLTSGEYKFKAGDVIKLGTTGHVYSVTDDVAHDSNTITVHRPVLEAAGTYTLNTGTSVSWDVVCVNFPSWTIFGYDQISWSGPFIFAEAL